MYDAIVDQHLSRRLADQSLPVFAGVDVGIKHDSTGLALVTCLPHYQRIQLVDHRVFVPTSDRPVDFTDQIEQTLLDWSRRFDLKGVWYDPHQMMASSQRLARQGLPMREFPQTAGNLDLVGGLLFDLIRGRNLQVYIDEQLRVAILHTVAAEGSRGWKLDKAKQTKDKQYHIDIVIALALACFAAYRAQGDNFNIGEYLGIGPPGLSYEEKLRRERAENKLFQRELEWQDSIRDMYSAVGRCWQWR
jgi:phage terminase large subunit-like protein